MKLTMLGTGNALVTECYNTCFVLSDGNDHFMVDGGGGMTVLHQLKYAGLDWRQMRTIFVTHKHIDHLLGIIWMMRMICQHMREGTYEGEATIYAHDEVIALLRDLAGKLLQKKELPFLDSRLHLIVVADGEEKTILGRKTTFFDIGSPKAKQYGFWITKNYRESYGMFAVNGILFNHESERRGENFVTRKITLAAARIAQGYQDKLYLGNLDSLRDWGYAKDYVECMWMILQHDTPEDFVIATGEYHTVREFCTLAFKEVGIELRWEGKGVDERGIDVATGKELVAVDPKYFRPAEVEQLLGDPTKAKTLLGWNPTTTSFDKLVRIMVEHDMKFVKKLYLKAQIAE